MGLVLNTHYCSGKAVSTTLVSLDACGTCGKKEMPKGCCSDKQTKLSVDDNHQFENGFAFAKHQIALNPEISFFTNNIEVALVQNACDFYEYKTGPPKTPIYIQIRSLII